MSIEREYEIVLRPEPEDAEAGLPIPTVLPRRFS